MLAGRTDAGVHALGQVGKLSNAIVIVGAGISNAL